MKNFIDIKELSKSELTSLLDNALQNKRSKTTTQNHLNSKNILLFFEKKSTRTRLSFDIAIKQLGGFTTILNKEDIHLGNDKESVNDTINTFGLYADGLILRVNDHKTLMSASKLSNLPVINALSNLSHPCQCLAGLMTLLEERGSLQKLNIVWMGPITNVANSWIEAFKKDLGFSFNIFCPEAWFEKYKEKMKEYDISTDIDDIVHHRIKDQILAKADAVMTDTWKSMGENIKKQDYDLIKEFRVTEKVMNKAKLDSIFMHCLPANRNEEVEESVIDGNNSRVWQEAGNRLFVQKEILKEIF
jgi:ornithine carbamoyltransferase